MPVIVVASVKGGVGKTTTAVALASGLANFANTFLVDLDSQGQVVLHYGLPMRSGVYHWLSGDLPINDCIYQGRPEGLYIVPGDTMTKALYNRFTGSAGAHQVAAMIRGLPMDFVVVDTAAGGLLQEAALLAADQVVIPFRCEAASIDSLFATRELVKQLAPTAQVTLLPTGYDGRLREHKNSLLELAQSIRPAEYGIEEMYAIRNRIAVAEAIACGVTIWEYKSDGIKDVCTGYSYLLGHILQLAGYDGTGSKTPLGRP